MRAGLGALTNRNKQSAPSGRVSLTYTDPKGCNKIVAHDVHIADVDSLGVLVANQREEEALCHRGYHGQDTSKNVA